MADLIDHAPHSRGILEFPRAANLVEAKANQRLALIGEAAGTAGDLGDAQRPLALCLGARLLSHQSYSLASALPSPVSRRPMISLTFLLRRAATLRGEAQLVRAAKAAFTMLWGFELPTDLATMSSMPSASQTARTGPPAMIPVPATAARMTTEPAPNRPTTS